MELLSRLKQILERLDLSPLEQKVFLANLELGSAVASVIAKKAGLNRITTYEILKRLSKKGLVNIRAKRNEKTKYFETQDTGTIKNTLSRQKELLETALGDFELITPGLRSFQKVLPDRPVVLFFEGKDGIENVIMDSLESKPYEILSFASADFIEESFDSKFLENYWKKRTEMKIPTRGLLPETEKAKNLFTKEKNIKELRQLRFIPSEQYHFENEIDIYGDNISIVSLAKDGEYGVIIRSRSIANGLRSIFEVLWASQI